MTDAPTPRDDDRALDDLGEQIERTEREAIDAGIISDPDEPRFADSGTIHPELDDQTIAPPG